MSLQGLSTAEYRKVMLVVEQAILSTDLALYFRKKDIFLETANAGEIDWQEKEKKDCELEEVFSTVEFLEAICKSSPTTR